MIKRTVIGIATAIMVVVMCPLSALAVERYEILQIGDEDQWVYELQEQLYDQGYLSVYPTGYFGTNTQNAVMQYQSDNGLQSDGKAGPVTRQALLGGSYSDISSSERTVKDTLSSKEAEALNNKPSSSGTDEDTAESETKGTYDAGTVIRPGDKGDDISKIQSRLKDLEYYDYGSITGYYGPITQEAVRKFQRTNGLAVDGIMGSASLTLLNSESALYYTMYPGDSGDDIREMQDRLRELGYFNGTSTGYFGNITKAAVQAFQNANGLAVDGKVGKNTRKVLYGDGAVAGSTPESSSEAPTQQQPEATQQAAEPSEEQPASNESETSSDKDTTPEAPVAEEAPPVATAPSGDVQRLIDAANAQIGKPYSYGSSGPNSFDCSGFVYYAMKSAGFATSRMSSASYANLSSWDSVDGNSLQVGDLVFFKSDKSSVISHMGIYLGGGSFIHAAPSSGGVDVSSMSQGYYQRNFVSAKRIL